MKNKKSTAKLLDIREVAELLNVKPSWVRSAIFKRKIPYLKVGKLVRFNEIEIKNWLDGNIFRPDL